MNKSKNYFTYAEFLKSLWAFQKSNTVFQKLHEKEKEYTIPKPTLHYTWNQKKT